MRWFRQEREMATELQQRCFVCGVHKEDIEEQLVLWETRFRFQHSLQ